MMPSIFIDSPVLLDAAWSDGPSRTLLRLAEAGAVRLLASSRILREVETSVRRKAPAAVGPLAVLLDQCGVALVPRAANNLVKAALKVVRDPHTAYILADAGAGGADYFATFDNERIVSNARLMEAAPFVAGSPADCLAWLKEKLKA